MQVETFECEETAAETPETSAEAIALIAKLGLKGQQGLIKPADQDGPASRSPYREATAEEYRVYKALCPTAYRVEQYARSPIPVRALQVIAHAASLNLFECIQVWDRESVQLKDPVAVGIIGNEWDTAKYKVFLLVRWGETLDEFPALRKKAIAAKRAEYLAAAQTAADAAARSLTEIRDMSEGRLLGF